MLSSVKSLPEGPSTEAFLSRQREASHVRRYGDVERLNAARDPVIGGVGAGFDRDVAEMGMRARPHAAIADDMDVEIVAVGDARDLGLHRTGVRVDEDLEQACALFARPFRRFTRRGQITPARIGSGLALPQRLAFGGSLFEPLELLLLLLVLGAALLGAFGSVIGSKGHRLSSRRQDRLYRVARKACLPGRRFPASVHSAPLLRATSARSRAFTGDSGNGWGWTRRKSERVAENHP